MHYLHSIFHAYSYQPGCRIDLDRELPPKLDDEELDFLLDVLSEKPQFVERISPVNIQCGDEVIYGKNWTDMMAKTYKVYARILSNIATYIHQTLIDNFKEKGIVPFTSFAIDPDTMCRILDIDYETGESTYIRFLNLYASGVIAPCFTIPFSVILPLLEHEYDVRLLVRISLLFYWTIYRDYQKYLEETLGEKEFVCTFFLPEGGFNYRVVEIIYEELLKKCQEEKIKNPHLVLLLDNEQSRDEASDTLMKAWNVIQLNKSKSSQVSVVFKNRNFSDWINRSTPSVKKLIDRTIAKSDSELNKRQIHYSWAHFENIEALVKTPRSVENFEQKIVKLAELGYLSLSPDMFVRRRLNSRYPRTEHEPRKVELKENTGWLDWHNHNISLGRWEGTLDSNAEFKLVDENRPYQRLTSEGWVEDLGPQCWKIALNKALNTCVRVIKGDPDKYDSGMLGILASLVGVKDKKIVQRNVDEFLVHYAYIHWREHFLHQGLTEADIYITELVDQYLLKDTKRTASREEYVIAALAAQAYYFALDSRSSLATTWENFDQRATYQSVVMATLALVNAIYIYRWLNKKEEEKEAYTTLKEELLEFHKAYDRYKLAEYGVTREEWQDAIKSVIEDCEMNVVERAAYRVAARHLRPLGYRKDLTQEHENLVTSTGHIWSSEIEHNNYKWDNPLFCGLSEEEEEE